MSDTQGPDGQDAREDVRPRDAAKHRPRSAAVMRQQAEGRIGTPPGDFANFADELAAADALANAHELAVHQIELEMQNEELRRAYEEVDQSRAFYAEHYDFAPLGYCTIDASGAFRRVNLAGAKMLGVPRSGFVGSRFSRFVVRADREVWQALGARLFGALGAERQVPRGHVETCELRMARPDGVMFWVHLVLTVADEDGVPVCHLALADITERKQAEEALRDSEERYRSVVAAMSEGIAVHAADGSIVACNASAQRILGLTEDEMLGRSSVDPRWRSVREDGSPFPGLEHPAMVTLRTRQPQSGVVMGVHTPDGRLTWISISSEPLGREPGAAPHGVVATFLDITERKRADMEIARREADLRAAQRLAHVGSWEMNAATGAVTWSEEMCRIVGLQPGSSIFRVADMARFFSPASLARIDAGIAMAMATGETVSTEDDVLRPDGTTRHVIVDIEAIRDAAGAVIGVRGTTADVTVIYEAQARLDQAQRVEMVGRLAAGVAHDFNNQLAAISGYTEILADSLPAGDPRHQDAAAILDAGGQAARLIRQLLAFGQRQTLRPVALDLCEVVAGLAPMLRSLLPAGVELVLPAGPAGAPVRVDRAGFEQTVVNLVLNARDAMSAGGSLSIAAREVGIGLDDLRLRPTATPGRYVRVTFADTGSGIEPAVLPHILEPFFTTKPFGQGSGLGLSSVDGFVAQSGGFLSVESTLGSGSTFSIYLPRDADAPPAAPPMARMAAARTAPVGGRETILVVDDEPRVLEVTSRVLRGLGYTVLEAGDPAAALAVAESGAAFDLLLTDLVMPGMNGRALAEHLADLRPALPVLFMSGYDPETVFADGLLDPGAPFLSKPFGRETLASCVRALLDGDPAGIG